MYQTAPTMKERTGMLALIRADERGLENIPFMFS
jgi:hypothetical protein